ncbi:MAG TPA: hypothetical protein VD968_07665, partial [Pyrinomonadaceae bacterium]|nr:hypothetical protein [Pyrinomonadaceae bacterium]
MAETPESDKLVKRDAAAEAGPAPDPITGRSTSSILLVCALLLTGSLVWALWDEVYGMRPWKGFQKSYVKRYERYLKRLERRGFKTEEEVKKSDEYLRLESERKQARAAVEGDLKKIDGRVRVIDAQLDAISNEFQNRRGRITVASYEAEVADPEDKDDRRRDIEEMKAQKAVISVPADDGSGKAQRQELDYNQIEAKYNSLKDEKGRLLAERGELLKESSELERKRDEYLKDNVTEATESQVRLLRAGLENFNFGIKQININGDQIVERCETCHVGVRSPIRITPADMMPAGRGRRPDK